MPWDERSIREKLSTDDKWVCHALTVLYARQTLEEKEVGYANKRNGMGFNSTDAFFFGRLAEFYINNGFLTKLQIGAARKGGIAKYWRQILEVIKANDKIKQERIREQNEGLRQLV